MTIPTRYEIRDLNVEGYPVLFTVGAGEVQGFVKFSRSGRPIYRVGTLRRSEDLPRHARPMLWRPLNPANWPEDLPQPAVIREAIEWGNAPAASAGPFEKPTKMDDWPYPGIRLGRVGMPPKSPQEAAARVLRAIRTADVLYGDAPDRGGLPAWPKDLVAAAAIVAKMLRNSQSGKLAHFQASDYADIHVDMSDLRPLPARWMPTPRDVSDVTAANWLNVLSQDDRRLFYWRAAMPPFSFHQIAKTVKSTEAAVVERYDAACVALLKRAASGEP